MPNAEPRDLDQTANQLSTWIGSKIEGSESVTISGLRGPSDTGFSSETLLFNVAWREDGEAQQQDMVIRLEPTGFNIFPSYDIPLQFRTMETLWKTDVPVPRMRWLEEDPSVLGVPFYVMDRVAGVVPTDTPPYHTAGWVSELAPERREKLWYSGLDAMARFHKLDWRALGFDSLDKPEHGATQLEQQLHYYEQYFSWGMKRERYPVTQTALDYLYANMPNDAQQGLCWGDSRLANQIFLAEECVAVIDWEMLHLGSPVEDLAWWLMADRCFSEGIGVERSAGFPAHDETIRHWEQATGLGARDLAYYEVLALMRFSIHIGRVGLQMKHHGILPEDNDFDADNLASQMLAKRMAELGV